MFVSRGGLAFLMNGRFDDRAMRVLGVSKGRRRVEGCVEWPARQTFQHNSSREISTPKSNKRRRERLNEIRGQE